MTTTINDTSYDAVSSYDLRNNIAMNKNTREYCYESNTSFLKIEKYRKKQIASIKFIPNNNHKLWWIP
jgi:hypothetical protein